VKFSSGNQQRSNQGDREATWDALFANIPAAPGTEAQQQRHKELREKGHNMTEAEEAESNALFNVIYPQIEPELRCRRERFGG
jgi:hypothetical protein